MFFFSKKRKEEIISAEKEIEAIRQETFEAAKKAKEETERVLELLEQEEWGVSGRIFLATGGDRRVKK